MSLSSVFVWTHDSIFLGEDGPTHQPIEHLAALRAIPNLDVIRPADPIETAVAWQRSINRAEGPSAIVLTRQGLRVPATLPATSDVNKGGYVRQHGSDVVLIATGSEVPLAEDVAAELSGEGVSVRVVSMPCVEWFNAQRRPYQESVLGTDLPVFTLEAASPFGWDRFVANGGVAIGIDTFGASAPAAVLAEKYGFTPEIVAELIRQTVR
jgi:transketolase